MAVDVPVLSARRINRAVLARQLLLSRADLDKPAAMQHVGGLQTSMRRQATWVCGAGCATFAATI